MRYFYQNAAVLQLRASLHGCPVFSIVQFVISYIVAYQSSRHAPTQMEARAKQ